MEYWIEYPPAHVILAAIHIKPSTKRRRSRPDSQADELRAAAFQYDGISLKRELPEYLKKK